MKPIALLLAVACAALPLHAQAPRDDIPMLVTPEERARINREFMDLNEKKEEVELKLYNCQSVQLVDWRAWW